MDFRFDNIRQVRPVHILEKRDDLKRPLLKLTKNILRIIAPYFWGSKHTDLWPVGKCISKLIGKNSIDTLTEDKRWISLPLPVYTSHVLYGPDHKRFNRDNIAPVMKKLALPGTIAIDVGASCGQEVVTLSRAVGEEGLVYCFEPSISYESLLRTVALNELNNVICIKAACGDHNGYISGTDNQEYFIGDEYSYADSGMVVIRIDDFLHYIGEKRKVSILKIDTDGFEYEVINGAKNTIESNNTRIIAEFEPHFNYSGKMNSDVLERYLEDGFKLFKIQTHYIPINRDDINQYLKDIEEPENMIAHDLVLVKR